MGDADLHEIMCFEEVRVVSRDFIVSFQKRLFQILPESRPLPRPGDKITVRARLDKTIGLYFRDNKLSVREINKKARKEVA
jgi:hypothetical protein